jgi:dipeptide transport system ATP-binding protein
VLNLLVELQRDLGLAYVFVSHDLSVVRHVADRVMVVYLGRVAESGTRDAIFHSPQHPYTRALLSATPVADPRVKKERIILVGELPSPFEPPSGCVFHPRCPIARPQCAGSLPLLEGTPEHLGACFAIGGWHFPREG